MTRQLLGDRSAKGMADDVLHVGASNQERARSPISLSLLRSERESQVVQQVTRPLGHIRASYVKDGVVNDDTVMLSVRQRQALTMCGYPQGV